VEVSGRRAATRHFIGLVGLAGKGCVNYFNCVTSLHFADIRGLPHLQETHLKDCRKPSSAILLALQLRVSEYKITPRSLYSLHLSQSFAMAKDSSIAQLECRDSSVFCRKYAICVTDKYSMSWLASSRFISSKAKPCIATLWLLLCSDRKHTVSGSLSTDRKINHFQLRNAPSPMSKRSADFSNGWTVILREIRLLL
jgi:hypothetical protein